MPIYNEARTVYFNAQKANFNDAKIYLFLQ